MRRFRAALGQQPKAGTPSPSRRSVQTQGGSTPQNARGVLQQQAGSHPDRAASYTNNLSNLSTPAVPDSMWFASDFMLGVGMVIIQPSTGKVVVLYEKARKYWFLPKGRKDVGETLEQAALREAYEEVCC